MQFLHKVKHLPQRWENIILIIANRERKIYFLEINITFKYYKAKMLQRKCSSLVNYITKPLKSLILKHRKNYILKKN